ncbi:hypothetical protein ACFWUQ_16155 [Streptomyces sp. NPDC058662]|uniref:hypothetical protein n=1 Tax=Streptomyces sp. NPDC058662 TaxID=3346583 RepID=UPI0036470F3B
MGSYEPVRGSAYSGSDWIGQSRHSFCVGMALHYDAKRREALADGDTGSARTYEAWGTAFLTETQNWLTGRFVHGGYEPKRIVPDEEAPGLRARDAERERAAADAAALAEARKRARLRAAPGAYRPYSGGLPTLGRRRR